MDPLCYTIPQAAKILQCKEEKILHMGSNSFWKIYALPSSFNLFYLTRPIIIELGDSPYEFNIKAPWNEDNRLPFDQQMQLAPHCLIAYLDGEIDADVALQLQKCNGDSLKYFDLYDSHGEPVKLKDCELVVEAKDVNKMKEGLKAKEQLERLMANNLPVIEQKVTKVTVYDERKISIENWLKRSGLTFDCRTKKEVFEMIKLAHKDNPLWGLNYDSYEKIFYRRYSKEIGLVGKSGAPPNSKRIKKN